MTSRGARGRWRSPLVALAALLTVVATSTTFGVAATPAGASPVEPNWTTIIQIENETPYQLRLLDSTTTEMTRFDNQARATIDPGSHDVSVIKNTNAAFGHGLAQILTYGVYRGSDYVGVVLFANGLDCVTPTSKICLDYHRWNSHWVSPLVGSNPHEGLNIQDIVDAGDQWGYHTVFQLRVEQKPRLAPSPATPPPGVGVPGLSTPWGWTQSVSNRTPFTLTKGWAWNSQWTDDLSPPPQSVTAGGQQRYLYQNAKGGHGPQSFVVYNAFDPTTQGYVGSVVITAATKCEAVGKVPIPVVGFSCIAPFWASNSFAASIPQDVLDAHSETSGFGPFDLMADTTVSGHPGPPPTPTPTPPPPPPPAPKTATTLHLTASVPASDQGQRVTFAATVSGDPGEGTTVPSGTVEFFDGQDKVGSGSLSGSGARAEASTSVASLPVGHHDISATYDGDSSYRSSSDHLPFQVDRASPKLTIRSSANPSPAGKPLTFAVSAVDGDGSPGAGTVIVTDYPDASNRLTITLHDGKGSGSLPNPLSPGLHQIGASWQKETRSESSGSVDQIISGSQATTTTITGSTPTMTWGQSVTFTAGVTVAGARPMLTGGTVQFDLDTHTYGKPIPLVDGVAVTKAAPLKTEAGPHTMTAVYSPGLQSPTNAYAASQGSLNLTLGTASTHTIVQASTNPARSGATVTFSTFVVANDWGAVGEVVYSIDGKKLKDSYDLVNGATKLVLGPEYSRPGHYNLTATYVPADNRFAASDSTVDMEVDPK
jgi:hypothetical protein